VDDENSVWVGQAETGEYAIHQYKDYVGDITSWTIKWIGKSTLAPSSVKVVLQIYDRDGTTWEDVAENNAADASTNFTLSGNISSDADHYKDLDKVISCRVYQRAY